MTLTAQMNLASTAHEATSYVRNSVVSYQTQTQLIVVDASLPRLDILLSDLAPGCSVLRIEPYQDAVARISEALTHSSAQSLAIVAHGTPGEVRLGRGGIDHSTLVARGAEIQSWGVEEIQLFSCHTGAAVQFVDTLEQLSGAMVFASTSAVGHADLGGRWQVTTTAGALTSGPFAVEQQDQWRFTLVPQLVVAADASALPPLVFPFDSYAVTIPNSVTSIGDSAFFNKPLTSVTIPNSVTSIGGAAFFETQLTSVTIPDSVTSIGKNAFANTPLTSVTIGNGVTSIGDGAFLLTQLTEVTIPDSVTSIGSGAFRNTPLTSVTIPNSVTSIGSGAFSFTPLTSVTIPNSVTSIGSGAFGSTLLTSVTIGNGVTSIGSNAFVNAPLTTVTIPDSVTSIESGAFGNTLLASVTLNNYVTLGNEAFPSGTEIILRNPTLTATITLDDPTLTAGETTTVNITFTEAVTDFTLDDLTADNGTLTELATADNITWTATFTPTADLPLDTFNLITLANTYTDSEGSIGNAATSTNYTIDTTLIVVPGKTLHGSFRKDSLTGMDGDDTIFGFNGKDTLSGAGGNDLIYGGWGKDVLNGGDGDDWLHGGWGKDLLTGGDGSDIFVLQRYGGKDTITDFDLSADKLGLTWGLGMSQLRFSGEKVLFRGREIAILEGIDTTLLTGNNFESV